MGKDLQGKRVDGHFWAKDADTGEILDPWLPSYDVIAALRGTTRERVYAEADKLTSRLAEEIQQKNNGWCMDSIDLDDFYKKYGFLNDRCYLNARIIKHRNKDRNISIVFGSMGFAHETGVTWWEFGHPERKTILDFYPPDLRKVASIQEADFCDRVRILKSASRPRKT